MTVIAMTREMGSLGKDVAAGVAERLGLTVVHHEVVERDVASKMNVGESDVHRFLEGKPSLLDRWKIDNNRLSQYTAEEILEIAADGDVVIRGWGAAALLRPVSHVLRVRVCAPMKCRVAVLQDRLDLDDPIAAQREIERNDAGHTRTLRALFETDWETPLAYDLVLNTERLPIDDCVSQVVAAAQSEAFSETEDSQQTLRDLVIERHVHSKIVNSEGLKLSARNIDITVNRGEVILSGATGDKHSAKNLAHIVKSIAGVRTVTNNIHITSYTA